MNSTFTQPKRLNATAEWPAQAGVRIGSGVDRCPSLRLWEANG